VHHELPPHDNWKDQNTLAETENPSGGKKEWVELPDCRGTSGEIPLAEDPAQNSSWATCKVRPANSAKVFAEKPRQWVELPDCRGGYGDIPLADEPGENSSWANCKIRPANAARV
jgi:hypothetical protein